MSLSTRVLVAADDPERAETLAARLDRLGFAARATVGPQAARDAVLARVYDAVVIDAGARPIASAATLARDLKAAARPRLLATALVAPADADARGAAEAFDAILREPVHALQIAARLQTILRLAVMEDEVRLRAQTLALRGAEVDVASVRGDFRPPQVLFVGEPTPYYLGLEAALRAGGGEVTAAFTSFTAFDYLHERDFDAVILNAVKAREPAFTIAAALRRNTRLFHLPALLFVETASFEEEEEAFARGVSDLLAAGAPPADLARRVVTLVRERQRREAVKSAFARARAPGANDPATGLASAEFFLDHLDNMIKRAAALERSLSLVILRAKAPVATRKEAREDAFRQLGSMVRHLVRTEDLPARIEPGVFVVAMPAADPASATEAAKRLAAIAECTAFDGGGDDRFQLEITTAVSERRAGDTSATLLTRAAAAFRAQTKAAG